MLLIKIIYTHSDLHIFKIYSIPFKLLDTLEDRFA